MDYIKSEKELTSLLESITSKIGNNMYFFAYDREGNVEEIICFKVKKFMLDDRLWIGHVFGAYVEDGGIVDIEVSLLYLGKYLFLSLEEAEKAREKELKRSKND